MSGVSSRTIPFLLYRILPGVAGLTYGLRTRDPATILRPSNTVVVALAVAIVGIVNSEVRNNLTHYVPVENFDIQTEWKRDNFEAFIAQQKPFARTKVDTFIWDLVFTLAYIVHFKDARPMARYLGYASGVSDLIETAMHSYMILEEVGSSERARTFRIPFLLFNLSKHILWNFSLGVMTTDTPEQPIVMWSLALFVTEALRAFPDVPTLPESLRE